MSEADNPSPTSRGTGTRSDRSVRAGIRSKHKAYAWALGIVGAIVPAIVLALIVTFAFTYAKAEIPDVEVSQKAMIVDSAGNPIAEIKQPGGDRKVIQYKDIPKTMTQAIVAAEDREFWQNDGFSARGMMRAVVGQVTGDANAGGGSTITQQYVKNAIVGDERSYERKFRELAYAAKMKASNGWPKERILEAYLNTIYFGRGAYGIATATQAYFGKPIEKGLTIEQAALIASIVRSPGYYDPEVNLDALKLRYKYVIDGMVTTGAITKQQAAEALEEKNFPRTIKSREASDVTPGPNGLIKRRVLAELTSIGITEKQLRTGGLKITTSISPQVQNAVVQAACRRNGLYKCPDGVLTGEPKNLYSAVVSIDPRTGGVAGYYGGDESLGWDLAQAGLQTGSSFKVFALVAALEQGIPLSKVYDSSPYEATGGLVVENSDGESCGSCNLATAMKMSLNTVYYRLMMDLQGQAQAVADAAHSAGVARAFADNPATLQEANGVPEGGVVLGQYPSRVIDMASAYATLAASGIYREPYFVQKVEDAEGNVLFDRPKNKGQRVFPAKVADNVTAALQPIAAYSNGHALNDPTLGARPSAAKTGTVQLGDTGNNKDAWMVGYTPQLSTAVWVGTKAGGPIVNVNGASIYGSGLPSQIWEAAMEGALDGKPIEQFPEPEAVGGQAGVPYEPPPVTYDTRTTRPTREPSITLPQPPGGGGDGNWTPIPGVTIPTGPPQRGGGGGNGRGNDGGGNDGGGNGRGNDGGGTGGDGTDEGGDVPVPPIG
ncbi:transglycosylase domain-containing protein [Gordonia sp. ABSL1-1]|uniref:transglycosylase domain-containing protein n=1 Tax=Gordonia sp. ABSL1-1 TaxID=3053923 RepID=UPI002572CD2F|nr:transglycosylase domain-containing protein [Gordonia sp. ABSL1-1]MDL9935317.1 transglycosylase domain-containing protein [Gordonia sp. ABSL1-1]